MPDANKWRETEWAAALTGKAHKAVTLMPVEEAGDYIYSKLKRAVLTAYDLTPEAYRIRLRSESF